jgi:hypothetical protein
LKRRGDVETIPIDHEQIKYSDASTRPHEQNFSNHRC